RCQTPRYARGARHLVTRTSAWTTADEVPADKVPDTSLRTLRYADLVMLRTSRRGAPTKCQTPRYGLPRRSATHRVTPLSPATAGVRYRGEQELRPRG